MTEEPRAMKNADSTEPKVPKNGVPDDDRPLTAAEMRTRLRAEMKPYLQAQRDKLLRNGRAKPRNYREMEIFGKDLYERGRVIPKDDGA